MKVEYKIGKFIDYAGNDRQYIMAAVSKELDNEDFSFEILKNKDHITQNLTKSLSIGVAVCKPVDKFDEKLGKRIARGKALSDKAHIMYVSHSGLINDTVVQAVLEQESKFFEENPQSYIAGYAKDKAKHDGLNAFHEYLSQLSGDAKIAYDYLKKASNKDIKLMSMAISLDEK